MGESALQARQALERDRAALAATLQALAAKADVKGRVRDTVHEDAQRVAATAKGVGPAGVVAAAVVAVGALITVLWVRHR